MKTIYTMIAQHRDTMRPNKLEPSLNDICFGILSLANFVVCALKTRFEFAGAPHHAVFPIHERNFQTLSPCGHFSINFFEQFNDQKRTSTFLALES